MWIVQMKVYTKGSCLPVCFCPWCRYTRSSDISPEDNTFRKSSGGVFCIHNCWPRNRTNLLFEVQRLYSVTWWREFTRFEGNPTSVTKVMKILVKCAATWYFQLFPHPLEEDQEYCQRHIWFIPLSRVAIQEQDLFSTLLECCGALIVITIVCSLAFQVTGFDSSLRLSHCFVYKTGCIAGHIAFA
jgi:hypothetical protein